MIELLIPSNPLTARFKADGYSKLVSAGKGFAVKGKDMVVNVDGGFLFSKKDPRNNLENYKRVNLSTRLTWNWERENWSLYWAPNLDYTGTIDDVKKDTDINYGAIDEYRSTYNMLRQTNTLRMTFPKIDFIKSLELNTSIQAQFDKLEQTKLVAPQRFILVPTGTEAGEHDASLLFSEYIADYLCDGKPFNSFVKLKGNFRLNLLNVKNDILAGGEWNYTKNF